MTTEQQEKLIEILGMDKITKEVVEFGNALTNLCKIAESTFQFSSNAIWFTPTPNHPLVPSGKQIHSIKKKR